MTIEVVVEESQRELHATEEVYMPPPELMIGDTEHPPQIITAARQRLSPEKMDIGKLSGLLTVDGPEALYRVQKGIIPDAIVVNIDGVFWNVIIVDNYLYFSNKDKTLTYAWLDQSDQDKPHLEIDKDIADKVESAWAAPRSPWGGKSAYECRF